MTHVSFKQYMILRRVKKYGSTISTDHLSKEECEICAFLCKKEYLEIVSATYANDFSRHGKVYKISQYGKAAISSYVAAFHKWWIPLLISILAVVMSCL